MSNYFEGYYFKHQKGNETVSLIPGFSDDGAFIQVITPRESFNMPFDSAKMGDRIVIGESVLGLRGVNINTDRVKGRVIYKNLTPLRRDIMGPFRFFPMECRHGILSMRHELSGGLWVLGKYYDFNGGLGYIEKDSGISFPKKYLWIHCNDFDTKTSIMVSVALIPFYGLKFLGCICAITHEGKEYRLATYNFVKINRLSPDGLTISQGRLVLDINIKNINPRPLKAPRMGLMSDTIYESNQSEGRFRLYHGRELVFDLFSENISFEYNM